MNNNKLPTLHYFAEDTDNTAKNLELKTSTERILNSKDKTNRVLLHKSTLYDPCLLHTMYSLPSSL